MILTRRDFLRASALGVFAGALPRSLASSGPPLFDFRELRRNVGVFTARGGTIGWLINSDGAVVVDSQYPDTAQDCLAGLRERSAPAIDALINSHHHGDHTAGNGVFREAAGHIVAHRRVPELQRAAAQGGAGEPTYPDLVFDDEWTLDVGDETVRAKHYGPAHTGGDCTIFFERANVVHMGDLVFNRFFPFIDRPAGASIQGWMALLEAVAAEHDADTLYVFGHGRDGFGVTGDRDDLLFQRDFLSALLDAAREAIADGRSREALTGTERLPGFPDHVPPAASLTLGMALGVAYDEVVEGGG